MDGTIVFRSRRGVRYGEPELDGSLSSTESVQGGFFEGKPVYFHFEKKKYPVWFRRGTFQFLQQLSKDGDNTIYLATHACQHYACRIRDYLEDRIRHLRIKVLTFQKDPLQLKQVTFPYEFIIEDKPERWQSGTKNIISIRSFDDKSVEEDLVLVGLTACLHQFNHLPDDIISSVGEFLDDKVPTDLLRKCNRCNRWCLAGLACDICSLYEDSETEYDDSFDDETNSV